MLTERLNGMLVKSRSVTEKVFIAVQRVLLVMLLSCPTVNVSVQHAPALNVPCQQHNTVVVHPQPAHPHLQQSTRITRPQRSFIAEVGVLVENSAIY